MIGAIGRAPLLTEWRFNKAISLALGGILGYWYYGRSTMITWEDCKKIEEARIAALRQRGFNVGAPRVQVCAARASLSGIGAARS